MGRKKYCIYQHDQFLGHHDGSSMEKAIERMLSSLYAKVYNVDGDDWFDVYKGSDHTQILMRPYEVYPEP